MERADAILAALTGVDGAVLLTGPVSPDGDSLGACLALQRVLGARGVRAVVTGVPPARFAWLPGADRMIPDAALAAHPPFAAVVVLDGDRHRLEPEAGRRFAAAPIRAIVDHHGSTVDDGYTHAWLEPGAESASGMLLRALRRWGIPVDPPLATLLYTGLVFDTGGFRHGNTRPETHRLAADLLETGIDHAQIAVRTLVERSPAALRAMGHILADATVHAELGLCVGRVPWALQRELALVDGDLEGVVDALVTTTGTQVAALLIERAAGDVKFSLRSRDDIDVAHVARQIHPTGGGHPRAAGASAAVSLPRAEQLLIETLLPHVRRVTPT